MDETDTLNPMSMGMPEAPAGPGSYKISGPKLKKELPVMNPPGSAELLNVAEIPLLVSTNCVDVPSGTSPVIKMEPAHNGIALAPRSTSTVDSLRFRIFRSPIQAAKGSIV